MKVRRNNRPNPSFDYSNSNHSNSSALILQNAPPKASAWQTDTNLFILGATGVGLLAADIFMSWAGFNTLDIGLVPSIALTALIAASQIGAANVQALGGSPRQGIGGNSGTDFVWKGVLPLAYLVDFGSNFFGFGGFPHLMQILVTPFSAIGMVATYAFLAALLCFGDEICFRLRYQLSPAAEVNRLTAQRRNAQYRANRRALNRYSERLMDRADEIGNDMPLD